MSGLVRRLEWDRQPPAPTRLRQEFGAEDGFAWTPFSVAESRRGESTAVRGATIVRPLSGSEVAAYATSATDAQRVSGRAGHRFGRTLFVFRFIHQGGSASFNFGYGRNDAAPSLYVEQFDANMDENGSTSVGKFRFVLRNIAGSSLMCGPSSAVLTTGVLNTVVLAATSSSTVVGWVNGSPITFSYSSTGVSDGDVGLPNKEFGILNFNYGSGDTWAGFSGADTNIGTSLVARLIVPAAAVGRELSVAPWQVFEPEQIYVPFASGGGAAALEGSLSASGTVSGALTTAIKVAASVSASASVTAALTTAIRPAASVSASATVSAALTTAIQMAGSLSATASVTGDISGAAALASSVSTSAIVTGDLTTAIRLNASVSGAATVTGVLADPGAAAALEASIAASATVSASLTGGSSTIWTPASASSGTWTPASAAGGTWVAQ